MVSTALPIPIGQDRQLMFRFEDVQYALPIAWIVEVA